jgi:ribokinase
VSGQALAMIGNLNMDLIIRGVPALPAWGQEVIGSRHTLVPAGQAGYTALALAAMGVKVHLVSQVGEDSWGALILEALRQAGVECREVESLAGERTGITVAAVREDGERAFVSDYAALHLFDAGVIRRHAEGVQGYPILAFCGLNTLPGLSLGPVAELFGGARRQGTKTVLDTGWDPLGWPQERLRGLREVLAEVSVFLPNMDEARALTGHGYPEKAAGALRDLGVELAVIKLGAEGCLAVGPGCEQRLPARSVEVLDAVGAGDVFDAGFMAGMLRGWVVHDCLALGSGAASLYISRDRDRFPRWSEVLEAAASYGALPGEGVR